MLILCANTMFPSTKMNSPPSWVTFPPLKTLGPAIKPFHMLDTMIPVILFVSYTGFAPMFKLVSRSKAR